MDEVKPVADLSRSSDPTHAVAIISACRRAARKAKWTDEKTEDVLKEMQAGTYEHLLAVAENHFELEY